jgi:uncharacterized protein YecA (UPF0149 family)
MPSPTEALTRLRQTERNADCPCGSGKKYKKCHLREDEAASSAALAESNAKIMAAAGEHVHSPDCEHEENEGAAAVRPAKAGFAGLNAPKQPMGHMKVNTPRKAV